MRYFTKRGKGAPGLRPGIWAPFVGVLFKGHGVWCFLWGGKNTLTKRVKNPKPLVEKPLGFEKGVTVEKVITCV